MTTVYRGYNAEALERQYMPRYTIPGDPEIRRAKWAAMSAAYRERAVLERDIAYGPSAGQRLDLLRPSSVNAPVLVFIHGGYWRSRQLDKISYTFALEPVVAAGALVATIDYDLCPDVTLDVLVNQVQRACAWVWRHARDYGGDPERLHVSGHSAGGHLSAMMAATDWPAFEQSLPRDMIKSIVPVSGLFDLEPLRLSSLNADLRLDPEAAKRNSPQYMSPATALPVSVVVGGGETDEFRRQSRDFADAWRTMASIIEYLETPGHHHFSVIEAMTEPDNPLTATILRHMQL
jgi:arylformamidase